MRPKLSVIVPTFNGEKKITFLLKSLCLQSFQDFELIVVVDGSSDNTLLILDQWKDRFQKFSIKNQENQGRAKSRNEGAKMANSELLLFIDDDIELDARNVQGHFQFHEANKDAVLFGNVMMDVQNIPTPDFTLFRYLNEKRWKDKFPEGVTKIEWGNYGFTSQNLSMSQQLFWELGGFDSSLTDSEDFDLSVRALLHGKNIFFHKGLRASHHDAVSIERYVVRQQQYYSSKIELVRKAPLYEELLPNHFAWKKSKLRDHPKRWLMGSKVFWVKFFQSKKFFSLPQAVRHYLYSVYIHTQSVLKFKK